MVNPWDLFMVYKIFRKNSLSKYFLVDYGRHKSRKDNSEQPRSLLNSQINDISWGGGGRGDSGIEIKILHMGKSRGARRGGEERKRRCVWL